MLSGPGFSELLRPDIVRSLLDELQLEERLAPYLPEVSVDATLVTIASGRSLLHECL